MRRIARIAQRLGRLIPEEELQRIPKDLASQVDHYVHGLPKRRVFADTLYWLAILVPGHERTEAAWASDTSDA